MAFRPFIAAAALALTLAAPAAAPAASPGAAPHGEILFDTFGAPHVYAKDEAGVFYGFGYATAQNHGDLVLKLYGEARGRGAEYWGEAEAASDRWVIANDVYTRAKAWYALQPPAFRKDLDAFAAGMNAYAAAHPDKIDPSVRQVLPVNPERQLAVAVLVPGGPGRIIDTLAGRLLAVMRS